MGFMLHPARAHNTVPATSQCTTAESGIRFLRNTTSSHFELARLANSGPSSSGPRFDRRYGAAQLEGIRCIWRRIGARRIVAVPDGFELCLERGDLGLV